MPREFKAHGAGELMNKNLVICCSRGRPKRLKDVSPLQELCNKQIEIELLDATMPTDNGLTNNQLRAAIRETRAKVNEIINVLNIR
jgi:hypothetical protein